MDRLPLKERFAQAGISEPASTMIPLLEGSAKALFHMVSLMTGTQHYELEAERVRETASDVRDWLVKNVDKKKADYSTSPYEYLTKGCYGRLLADLYDVLSGGHIFGNFTQEEYCETFRRILIDPLIAADDIRQSGSEQTRSAIQQAWEAYQVEYRKDED